MRLSCSYNNANLHCTRAKTEWQIDFIKKKNKENNRYLRISTTISSSRAILPIEVKSSKGHQGKSKGHLAMREEKEKKVLKDICKAKCVTEDFQRAWIGKTL